MATITERNIDVSSYLQLEEGTTFLTHTIKEKGLPLAAVVIDHSTKQIFLYLYQETKESIILEPIESDDIRDELQKIVVKEILPKEEQA
jgi:hypothetical protein